MKYLQSVHEIELEMCKKIGDEGLRHLANVPKITLTNVNITDSGLAHLSNVHTISLMECNQITGEGLKHLAKAHKVELSYCEEVKGGLQYLSEVDFVCILECPVTDNYEEEIHFKKGVRVTD